LHILSYRWRLVGFKKDWSGKLCQIKGKILEVNSRRNVLLKRKKAVAAGKRRQDNRKS